MKRKIFDITVTANVSYSCLVEAVSEGWAEDLCTVGVLTRDFVSANEPTLQDVMQCLEKHVAIRLVHVSEVEI